MSEPWFDANTFGTLYGAIGGGVGGSLMGCLGAFIGYFAPRGKHRRFAMSAMLFFLVLGVIQLALGLVALMARQPFGIWYPMLLCGGIAVLVIGPLLPMIRLRYAQAEQRRLDAEGLRQS